jgi:hypothetical protein
VNDTIKPPCSHLDPSGWLCEPAADRPHWIRVVCRRCGRFIGFMPEVFALDRPPPGSAKLLGDGHSSRTRRDDRGHAHLGAADDPSAPRVEMSLACSRGEVRRHPAVGDQLEPSKTELPEQGAAVQGLVTRLTDQVDQPAALRPSLPGMERPKPRKANGLRDGVRSRRRLPLTGGTA